MPNVRHLPNHANHSNRRNLHGKMSRRQPELVNGFVPLANEDGEWLYFIPTDVKRMRFTPLSAEQTEQTTE